MSCNLAAHAAMRALHHPDPDLNSTDRAIFAEMVYRANGDAVCYKPVEHFMQALRIGTRQTVSASTRKLSGKGYISIKRRYHDSNHYEIKDPDGYLYAGWQPSHGKNSDHVSETIDVKNSDHVAPDTGKEIRPSDVKNSDHVAQIDVKKTDQESVLPRDKKDSKKESKEVARAREAPPDECRTVFEAWNRMTLDRGLQPARSLTDRRRARLRERLREHGLATILEAIDRIGASAFCRGANNRRWKADFDFLIQSESLTRALEGRYDDRPEVKSVHQQLREEWGLPSFLADNPDAGAVIDGELVQ